MIRLIVELFVLYIIYKLVFGLIIPVFKATRHMNNKMKEMQQQQRNASPQQTMTGKTAPPEDYIDYEEIKD